MKQTLFVRLETDKVQFDALLETIRRFNEACNFIAFTAYKLHTANKMRLQRKVYRQAREKFGLSAQMAIRAIAKVCEAYKQDRSKKPTFKPHGAMVYDQGTLHHTFTCRMWVGRDIVMSSAPTLCWGVASTGSRPASLCTKPARV